MWSFQLYAHELKISSWFDVTDLQFDIWRPRSIYCARTRWVGITKLGEHEKAKGLDRAEVLNNFFENAKSRKNAF